MKEYDRTYAEVNLDAIRHNIMEARKNIKKDTKIMAIVKANAYGHGAVVVAKALEELVDACGVAMIEEALELRNHGLDKMILILGYTGEEWFSEVVEKDISQTIYTYEMAKKLNDVATKLGKQAKIHIKIDTGMGRIGFLPIEKNINVIKEISELSNLTIEGAFTHFPKADESDITAAKKSFQKYKSFVEKLEECGIDIPVKHVSNSASIMAIPEANLDMVRSGISTYGLYPSKEVSTNVLKLRPAMQWKAKVSYVKEVEAGTTIGYGSTFVADKNMKVATIPVGYADGMKRDLSNKGRVLIHGQYAPILGRICMDQFMVDVTDIEDVTEGDAVTIFGRDGSLEIPVEEVADMSHSFNYEFICSVSSRVPRYYIEDKK